MKAVVVSLVFGAGFTSCANFQKENSGAELRKEGYEVLLKTVKPGMYRRQLYAVLPPCEKPLASPPSLVSVGLTPDGSSTVTDAHLECHFLDDECYLVVFYQLKNGREYGLKSTETDSTPANPVKRGNRRGSIAITPDVADVHYRPISDWLPLREGSPPSKENLNDIIISTSGVTLRPALPDHFELERIEHPVQKTGKLFGRSASTR